MGMMELAFPIIMAIILAIVFAAIARRRLESTPVRPVEMDWDAFNDPQIQTSIEQGQKIEAIKRYRELTGAGLKESKEAIEYAMANPSHAKKKKAAYDTQDAGVRDLIQEGRLDEAVEVYRKFAGVDAYTARDAVAEIEGELRLGTESASVVAETELRALLQQGKKIEAIKAYRQATGLGLEEARNAIEAIEKRHPS